MMLISQNFLGSSKDMLGTKVKVEEQMVPSGGLSPQPDACNSSFGVENNYTTYGSSSMVPFDVYSSYGNLADTFDLSLLDDSDMATVPSPMSNLETSWQQTSFYAPSPSNETRAFSPDCMKPIPSSKDRLTPAGANHQNAVNRNMICSDNGISTLSPSNDVSNNERNTLLKQCLQDTSFQSKFLPAITVNDDDLDAIMKTNASLQQPISVEINQSFDPFNFAYEQMLSEARNACKILSISQDPTQWSVADVQSWLVHSMRSMDISSNQTNDSGMCAVLRNFWNMDGRTLCSLSEDEFRRRDAVSGEKLYANVELFKTLQWSSGSTTASNTPQMLSPRQDWDFASVVEASNALTGMLGGSSPASVCTDVMDDASVYSDNKCSSKLYVPARFSSPSSVGTLSKNSDDDEDSEEEEEKSLGRAKSVKPHGSKSAAHIHLWQFLKELLEAGQQHSCIRWLDQSRGVFKIEDSVRVARLWGIRKNRPAMNYDKLSRSIRQYYRKGIMRKTERSQRLVYQFCHPYGC